MVHELIFTTDNPCCTTIYDSTSPDEIIYHIDSRHDGKKFYTVVKNKSGQELAKLEWKDSTPDIVHFADDVLPSRRMNSWMKPSLVPFVNTRSFVDVKGRKYKWKHVGPGSSMELWSPDVPNEPISIFQRSYPVKSLLAKLVLGDRALEIQDLVVISFLFLEKENRIRVQASGSRANAAAATAVVGGN